MRDWTGRTQIIVGILVTISVGVIIILILGYFGILPSPPKSAGPSQPFVAQPASLPCPLEQKPCPQGEVIENSPIIPNFYGIGYSLPPKTAVVAIIPGEYTIKQEKTENGDNRIIVTITSLQKSLTVRYIFQGSTPQELESDDNIDQGKILGYLEGKSLGEKDFAKSYNFVIAAENLKDRQYLKLQFQE